MISKSAKLRVPVGLQIALIVSLFLGSIIMLAYGALTVRTTPEIEHSMYERLRQASSRMAAAAATIADRSRPSKINDGDSEGRSLSEITDRVLRNLEGVEGGFYLNGQGDRFSGYAFPTARPQRPRHKQRDEPPPQEQPYIRILARESLSLAAGQGSMTVRNVGPSRVMILTEPVGARRPAAAATWLMYRLVDPRLLDRQAQQYRASSGLALGGLLLALLLMAGLARNLKRQQQEQARLQDELRRSERLAALGKLLAGVAHEVRNPLAAIRSTVQLWQRMPESSQTPESLDAVIRAVDRLNETVSQLLHFSRSDATAREAVNINGLLRETLELFAAQAGSQRVEVQTDLSDEIGIVYASADALRQVFVNLATNALQAMPGGGTLEVATHPNPARDAVVVEFVDSGSGIPTEVAPHLFEPFFTTRPEGTGLGLALCREIVQQHQGAIQYVESAGSGARFRMELPN